MREQLWDSLDQTRFYLDWYRNGAKHLWHSPAICHLLSGKASDWAAKIYVRRNSKPVSVARNPPLFFFFFFLEAKSKSPPRNTNQNMGVSDRKRKEGKNRSNFLNLSIFILFLKVCRNSKQARAIGFCELFQSHMTTETENVVKSSKKRKRRKDSRQRNVESKG